MRLIENQWVGPPEVRIPEECRSIAERILYARGATEKEKRDAFLSNRPDGFHDPFLLPDMHIACSVIIRAVLENKKILIYGDYDADGITATAILLLFLKRIGASVDYIIPDRVSEGYGISESLFSDIFNRSPNLIVTVDCGISNVEEIERLSENGVDVIVTDHHEVKDMIPDAKAVVSAKRTDSEYPFPDLCGAGIALKLVQALCRSIEEEKKSLIWTIDLSPDDWMRYLDLAAIGTIADVVPLSDENRAIVKIGLSMLSENPRPGMHALTETANGKEEVLTSVALSYQIVPKINAAGRMGDASRAVELLIETDLEAARAIARDLNEDNIRRQEMEASMLVEAIAKVEEMIRNDEWTYDSPLVVFGPGWHPGIVGIIASRLVQRYRRSAIVFTDQSGQEGILKASARASADYNILEAIRYASDFLMQYGGHPKAAGITAKESEYEGFRDKIREFARKKRPENGDSAIRMDAELSFREATLSACREIQSLQPFGEGNREPLFVVRGARIVKTTLCGQDRHLRISFERDSDTPVDGIAFGFGEKAALFPCGRIVDVAFYLRISNWADRETVSVQVVDMRFSRVGSLAEDEPDVLEKLFSNKLPLDKIAMVAGLPADDLYPKKEVIGDVYRFLKKRFESNVCECDTHLLAAWINAESGTGLNAFSLMRILDIFEQAGLLRVFYRKNIRISFTLLFVEGKVKLENTEIYQRMFGPEDRTK